MKTSPSQSDIDQFWKIYLNLPPDVQKAIFSEETAKAVQGLVEQYGLEDQPVSKLGNIVGDTLLGLLNLEQIPARLQQEYSLSGPLTQKLSSDLESLIFQPLRGNLKKLDYLHSSPPKKLKDIYGEPVE